MLIINKEIAMFFGHFAPQEPATLLDTRPACFTRPYGARYDKVLNIYLHYPSQLWKLLTKQHNRSYMEVAFFHHMKNLEGAALKTFPACYNLIWIVEELVFYGKSVKSKFFIIKSFSTPILAWRGNQGLTSENIPSVFRCVLLCVRCFVIQRNWFI